MLLPADEIFFEYIKERHNIELNEEDLKILNQFHFEQNTIYSKWLTDDPDAVFYDIKNGKVLGVVAFGVVGLFAAPLLGVSSVVGALMGASIGWRLFGQKTQIQNADKLKSEKIRDNFGFDNPSPVPAIGDVVPLIYCSRSVNPNGGVRVNGRKVNIRIDTHGNSQYYNAIYVLGMGQIKSLNENYFKLNGQLRYLISNICFHNRLGTKGQPPINELFYAYSQVQSINSNNEFGLRYLMKLGGNVNGTVFSVNEEQFVSFNFTDYYVCNGQLFRVIDKQNNNLIFITPGINAPKNANIYITSFPKIRTSKRCTEIHLNMIAQLWARNNKGELRFHGVSFNLFVDHQFIHKFYVQGKSENVVRFTLIIQGLSLKKHLIEITNDDSIDYPFIVLGDNNRFIHTFTNVYLDGKQIVIKTEESSFGNISIDSARKRLSPDSKQQICTDRGFPIKIVSINELVYPGDIGHSQLYNYDSMAVSSFCVEARDGISGDVDGSFYINEGRIIRNHVAAGFCYENIDSTLTDYHAQFISFGVQVGMILRNLDKQIQQYIVNVSETTITTSTPLYWQKGDRYLVYYMDASPYLPDIAIDTLINKEGGLGGILNKDLIADYFIDYESFCYSRRFCKHNGFYWDWYIDQQQSWKQWISEQSLSCLCYPTEVGNRFGMLPEDPNLQPVALFNASNILKGSYTEEYPPKSNLNFININYRKDTGDGDFTRETISVLTDSAYNGFENIYQETLNFDCITNEQQAIKVAKIYLNTRRYQNVVVNFSTMLQGFVLREGNIILIQHTVTEQAKEMSGFVIETQNFNAGTQLIKLSVPIQSGLDSSYSASIYRLRNGTLQRNLPVAVINIDGFNWLQISGLNEHLSPPTDDYNGDYVIVSVNVIDRRQFKVSRIEPSMDGSVKITAILWTPKIFDDSDLVVLN